MSLKTRRKKNLGMTAQSVFVDESGCDSSQRSDDTISVFVDESDPFGTQPGCDGSQRSDDTNFPSDNSGGNDLAFKFTETQDLRKLLTEGVATTKGEAVSLIMAYALRHNLSSCAVVHLLKLINNLFGREVVPDTAYLFNKLFDMRDKIHIHLYCKNCNSNLGRANDIQEDQITCRDCEHSCDLKSLKSVYYFISIPLGPQFQALLENKDISLKLINRNDLRVPQNCVRDIYDGALYRNLMVEGSILSDCNNYSYTFNIDGASVFKSSGYAIWPIHVSLNELPYRVRNDNTLLAGLWFSCSAPDMAVFVQSFVEDANRLAQDGVSWRSPDGHIINSKFVPLVCTVDSVARPLIQNMVQYNGVYGCPFCKHPGKQVQRGNGTSHVYPIQIYPERSEEESLHSMRQAVAYETRIQGFKGPSVLINLPHFHIISGFSPEYMHCVLLGVTRQLTNIFLKSVGKNFYIGTPQTTATVDDRLTHITPVSEITRCPRSITDVRYWKASEWKSWLLYYSIPCLTDIIPSKHLKHLAMLSESVFILLKEMVTFDEINKAHSLLLEFVGRLEMLYGVEECTFNVHLLTHLAKSVKNWGPLWAHSVFGFEGANGKLTKLIQGTQFIPKQIVRKFLLSRALPLMVQHVDLSSSSEQMYRNLTQHPINSVVTKTVEDAVMLGRPVITQPSASEVAALSSLGINPSPSEIHIFKRMIFKGQVIHSVEYTRAVKRNDSVIFQEDKHCVVVKLATYIDQDRVKTVLFLRPLIKSSQQVLVSHICKIVAEEDGVFAAGLDAIKEKCLYFSTSTNEHYVCHLPNRCERD